MKADDGNRAAPPPTPLRSGEEGYWPPDERMPTRIHSGALGVRIADKRQAERRLEATDLRDSL